LKRLTTNQEFLGSTLSGSIAFVLSPFCRDFTFSSPPSTDILGKFPLGENPVKPQPACAWSRWWWSVRAPPQITSLNQTAFGRCQQTESVYSLQMGKSDSDSCGDALQNASSCRCSVFNALPPPSSPTTELARKYLTMKGRRWDLENVPAFTETNASAGNHSAVQNTIVNFRIMIRLCNVHRAWHTLWLACRFLVLPPSPGACTCRSKLTSKLGTAASRVFPVHKTARNADGRWPG